MGRILFDVEESVDEVFKSMQNIPKEYEKELKYLEKTVRQYIEKINYFELAIEDKD